MLLVPFLSAEHCHGKFEIYLEQKKYADSPLSVYGQKEIKGLFEKDIFKVITPDKVIMPKEVPSNI